MQKGKLLYENPKNDRTRVYLSFLFMGFVCFLILAILYDIANEYSEGFSLTYGRFLKLLFLIFSVVVGGILATTVILIPRFKIYESGITRLLSPIHIFRKEGDFIPYEKIKAYTRYWKGERCVIYLERYFEGGKVGYIPIRYIDNRKGVIDTLEEHLKRHGIKEMPENCPNCNNKLYTYTEKCLQCGQKIFPEGE